jgi:hypothetical protein
MLVVVIIGLPVALVILDFTGAAYCRKIRPTRATLVRPQ